MSELLINLRNIVGRRYILTTPSQTAHFRKGFRFGNGPAIAVVQPGSLIEQWRVLKACHQAGVIVIMQAANTGLTGGSTPDGEAYDRPIVIINTMRMDGLFLIDEARQVICLPGVTLFQLERTLRPLRREPHSVIGSSCLGASVFGGVANNSGGALVRRGPAFTQLSLYARVTEANEIELVNHLGVQLGDNPEGMLERLEAGSFSASDIEHPGDRVASDPDYTQYVREIEEQTPARFNADPRRLYESAGSAGKLMMFAVRLDTFPMDKRTSVFYIGTNKPAELTQIRRHILGTFKDLPVAGEYIHRDAFNMAEVYGKDVFLAIKWLGTDRLPKLFALKAKLDALATRLSLIPENPSDRLMQWLSRWFPQHLPASILTYRDKYEHHLLLKMPDEGIEEAREYLKGLFPSQAGNFFECSVEEGAKAFLHRFAVAGAVARYRAVHRREAGGIVALDIALPRNETNWVEHLPLEIEKNILHKLYYGHFFCYVFHQDYVVENGADPVAVEHDMWRLLDQRGAEYPAEHNVGHLYKAKPALMAHYEALDPCNCFNPGIGQTSKLFCWGKT